MFFKFDFNIQISCKHWHVSLQSNMGLSLIPSERISSNLCSNLLGLIEIQWTMHGLKCLLMYILLSF